MTMAIITMMSLMFLFMMHPLSMGLILLIQTILISLITGMMAINYWFSYILFLILVGGMLILFIYMTSIASNEKFNINTLLMSLFIIPCMTLIIKENINFKKTFNITNEMNMFNEMPKISISMIKYIHTPMNILFIFMILYLFMTLIAIVKITHLSYGPIRSSN